ncbi:hypothetical protein [Paracraurococcus ruber]|uniref:Uncharacterized protein n=1 Tax=Paracraurococcus ruber TaxID=77675 RepID=A0ABS1CYB4_9PROT|nr:hypothetical protein [Paracraurococcus ruber]MBK1658699.1 hypothetical protein [Paracraurococcus ruber]TDG32220.1 hypothetical protein E2C05_08145 [Paracraurococcus ruber]
MTKSWDAKFQGAKPPHVVVLDKPFAGLKQGQRLFIASPALLETRIRAIPAGTTQDPATLRAELAREHGADATCPASTGIFLRIIAERALERLAAGDPDPAPFWRVVAPASPLAAKLSCGAEFLSARRAADAPHAGRHTGRPA